MDPNVEALLSKENWHDERRKLRDILCETSLSEEVKWRQLCYTFQGKNVAIIHVMKESCGVGFFKGSLLHDPQDLLVAPGPNSQASRVFRFTDLHQIEKMAPALKAFVAQAIEIEKAGLKVEFGEKDALVFPEELQRKLDQDSAFKTAFEALTPGRRRGYNLHFSAPKQSKTRVVRIEKCEPRILAGKGLNDR